MPRFPSYMRARHADQDEANIRRATRDNAHLERTNAKAPAGGDNQRLRGIPAIGPGVTGAVPGTIPGRTFR